VIFANENVPTFPLYAVAFNDPAKR